MARRGRKSVLQELNIKQRYSDLAPEAFAVIKEFLNSKKVEDRKWAVEQLSKGFQKMIPQEISGVDGQPINMSYDSTFNVTRKAKKDNSESSEI